MTRVYVIYLKDDWTDYLFLTKFLTKFAANNKVLESTILSPFFANFDYYPCCDFELDFQINDPEEFRAQTVAAHMHRIHKVAKSEIQLAQS